MDITVNQEGKTITIKVNGDIDENGAEMLKAQFGRLNLTTIKDVIIDFSNVHYIGSSGIGKLLLFYKNIAVNGGSITIVNTQDTVYSLFQELKLNSILTIQRV